MSSFDEPVASHRRKTHPHTIADLTTIRTGGVFAAYREADSETEVIRSVREADQAGQQLLVLGGGSNTFASDDDFRGLIVRDRRSDIQMLEGEDSSVYPAAGDGDDRVLIRVLAGTPWDDFVVYTLTHGYSGLEALSGIPGTVGAAPVQNIGAYGQEVAQSVMSVRVYDRVQERIRVIAAEHLDFGYRTSLIKKSIGDVVSGGKPSFTPRYVVLSVDFALRSSPLSSPVAYQQLARELDVQVGQRATTQAVRQAVLKLRRSKGMVLDDANPNTYSCGSFFTNPIVRESSASRVPADAPRYPVPGMPGYVKLSAAWLLTHAGADRGFSIGTPARLSTQHSLAVTSQGRAGGAEVLALARAARSKVLDVFGVALAPEPVLVGHSL
ncbi:MAG: UDP-N-acetylmuramate dehydrogenase [Actinomycetaceae bacterium]|nr:UDP-N-acetylmuramate dehydrogenase [Actinomycetaceae bacterium]